MTIQQSIELQKTKLVSEIVHKIREKAIEQSALGKYNGRIDSGPISKELIVRVQDEAKKYGFNDVTWESANRVRASRFSFSWKLEDLK